MLSPQQVRSDALLKSLHDDFRNGFRSQLRQNVIAQHNSGADHKAAPRQHTVKPSPPIERQRPVFAIGGASPTHREAQSTERQRPNHNNNSVCDLEEPEPLPPAVPAWAKSSVDTYCSSYHSPPVSDHRRGERNPDDRGYTEDADSYAQVDSEPDRPLPAVISSRSPNSPLSPQSERFVQTLLQRQREIQYQVEQAQQRLMTMLAGSTMNLDPSSMEQLNAEVTHWLALDRQVNSALQTQRDRPISPPTSPQPRQQTADEAPCAFCGTDCAESPRVCPDCSSVCYCSADCQSAAFPDHRLVCQSQQCSSNGVAPVQSELNELSEYPDIDQLQRDLRDQERRRSGVQIGDSDCEDVVGDSDCEDVNGDSDCEDVECGPRWHDDDDNFENVSARGGQYGLQNESDESDCESFSDRRSHHGSQAHRRAEDCGRSLSGKSQVSKTERVQSRKLSTAEVKARGRVKQYRAVKQAYLVPGRQYAHQRDGHQSRPAAVRLPNVKVNLPESTGAARLRPAGLYDPEPIEDLEARVLERLRNNKVALENRNFGGGVGVRSADGWNKFLT